ncbi:MAG: acetyltransferase [Hymenobacter sp.]|nr:MAG: acetyltransferase [Hymenobacter sp.]
MRSKTIIYGIGRQAELMQYLFTHDSPHEVAAFCVEAAYLPSGSATLRGLPIVAFEDLYYHHPPTAYQLHIAVGQPKARQRLFEAAKAQGYGFTSYVSSKSSVWPDLQLGEHVFIDQPSIIHPLVTIGDNAFLIGPKIAHHSVIGSHVLLTGATLGGNVQVGDGTFLGMGSVVNENLRIGQHNIIGAGAIITRHTEDGAVYTAPTAEKRLVDARRVALFRR